MHVNLAAPFAVSLGASIVSAMACRCTAWSLIRVLGLLLTPLTPLAQALPCRPIRQAPCDLPNAADGFSPDHRYDASSQAIPWWWSRLPRKRVLDDSPGVPIEERLWQVSRRLGALSADAARGLSVPVRCVVYTMWFGALCLQKVLVALVGRDEMLIWIDVAHAWTDGAQQFVVVSDSAFNFGA